MKLKCLLLAFVLICSFMLSGCYLFLDEELGGVLDSEIAEKIKTDYARRNSLNADKLEIVKYFGRCGENYIVLIRNLEIENPSVFSLNTVHFQEVLSPGEHIYYGKMGDITVWSKEGFCSLKTGFLKGIVSMDMLKYIKSETDKIYPYLNVDKSIDFKDKMASSSLKSENGIPVATKSTFIINTVEELNNYFETYLEMYNEYSYSPYAEYTSEFFADKSLVIAFVPLWDSMIEGRVEKCYMSGDNFIIYFDYTRFSILSMSLYGTDEIIVEVDKDDVQDVEDIYVIVK